MLQRVVLGQVRFNLPGLSADARGVVSGKQLAVRFAAIDRLVAFLRALSAEQSLDDLQPGLRIVVARGGAGTREAIILMPVISPGLGDAVAQAARLAGGQTFTGTGKHLVQFRDARAPLGYDVPAPPEGAGDVILHGVGESIPYRIETELPLGKLLLRLSLVHVTGPEATLPEGPVIVTARRGLGTVLAGYLHRAARTGGLRGAAALCESAAASAFAPGSSFWLFRMEQVPARMHGLLRRTPGVDLYLPVTENVAVAVGHRHPIHLESCRGSFPLDRVHLFSPRGVIEVAPAPVLAPLEDVVRIRVPAPVAVGLVEGGLGEVTTGGALRPSRRPDLAITLRLEASGESPGHPVATLVPWARVPWLRRLFYALPPTVLRSHRVALLEPGVLLRASDVLEGIPFGTLLEAAAPDVLVPLGSRFRPAVSRDLISERLGATGGALVVFPERGGRPLRIPPEAMTALEPRILEALDPQSMEVPRLTFEEDPLAQPIEIENEPLGPMPLWGLGRGRTPG